jgi:glycyl-tRNA synthetase beta subunit
MAAYRAYRVDQNKHIKGPPMLIVADNDAQATEQAKQFVDGCDVELWDGARMVLTVKASNASDR